MANVRKEYLKQIGKSSRGRDLRRRFFKNKTAVIGLVIFTAIVLMAVCAPLIADYQGAALKMNPTKAGRLQPPSSEHLLGTDEMGRDILARVVHGARISLVVGIASIGFALLIGGALGAIAGYFGGLADSLIMRLMDVFLCLPDVLLALAIAATFGTTPMNLTISIGLAFTPKISRVVRAAVMSVRSNEYIEAAKSIGVMNYRIITEHVLVNCVGPIIVQVTMYVASAILTISALSFIGQGIQAPIPEWGNMLASGRNFMRDSPHVVIAPGMAIFFTILSLNLLGDGLRDTLDPRLK